MYKINMVHVLVYVFFVFQPTWPAQNLSVPWVKLASPILPMVSLYAVCVKTFV